jgi:hypothetical protein
MTSALAQYVRGSGSYGSSTALVMDLAKDLPEASPVLGPAHTVNQVSVAVSPDGQVAVVAVRSMSGSCWYAEDNESPKPGTGGMGQSVTSTQGSSYAELAGHNASCQAPGLQPLSTEPHLVWQRNWLTH